MGRMFVFTWLSLITHMLLDFCTAYGTQLLLPFSDARLGLDCINVVDPVYTLPLLIGVLVSIVKRIPTPNTLGLLISSLYLISTFGIKHTAVHEMVRTDLKEHDIEYVELQTMPVGIASINWYAIAKSPDSLYLKKFSLLDEATGDYMSFPINEHLLDSVDVDLAEQMRWFSKGFYTVSKRGAALRFFNLQVDMRGFVDDGFEVSPTAGYFELSKADDGKWLYGSGTVLPK